MGRIELVCALELGARRRRRAGRIELHDTEVVVAVREHAHRNGGVAIEAQRFAAVPGRLFEEARAQETLGFLEMTVHDGIFSQ